LAFFATTFLAGAGFFFFAGGFLAATLSSRQ
jgi:hypothetical protein